MKQSEPFGISSIGICPEGHVVLVISNEDGAETGQIHLEDDEVSGLVESLQRALCQKRN